MKKSEVVTRQPTEAVTPEFVNNVFKSLEQDENQLYRTILSFYPLGYLLVEELLVLFKKDDPELPQGIERQLKILKDIFQGYAADNQVSQQQQDLHKATVEKLIPLLYLQVPAKDWGRFVGRVVANPAKVVTHERFGEFQKVHDSKYLRWSGKVTILCKKIAATKNKFVVANQGLAGRVVSGYYKHAIHLSRQDLFQEACFGLIKAIDRFDYKRDIRFSTYATWWVRHSVNRSLADKETDVRVPVHIRDKKSHYNKFVRTYLTQNGEMPSNEVLIKNLKLTEKSLEDMQTSFNSLSLNRPLDGATDTSYMDVLEDPSSVDTCESLVNRQLQEFLEKLLADLNEKEQSILRGRFGFGVGFRSSETLKLIQIGKQHDLSRERIRQIEAETLQKLRSRMRHSEYC